jgi:hypothetical protein
MRKSGLVGFGMALKSLLILLPALLLEGLVLCGLLSDAWQGEQPAMVFLPLHLCAAVVFALVSAKLSIASHPANRLLCALPFFAAALFLSLAGMAGTLGVLLAVRRSMDNTPGNTRPFLRYRIPRLDKLPRVSGNPSPPLDRDGIAGILSRSSDPGARIEAILLTLKLKDKDAVSLLRTGLKDRVDDIRLLAYSLLSRKEKTIYDRIDATMARLKTAAPDTDSQLLYQILVSAYWELVYCGLAEGDAARFLLRKAHDIAMDALKRYPGSTGLYFQLGRILLLKRDYRAATLAFKQANILGTDEKKLLPYFAEIAYYEHRFSAVKTLLENISHGPYPNLSAAAGFWRG